MSTLCFQASRSQRGDYLVVAADVAAFQAKYPGVVNVVGGWTGQLSNSGEDVELEDALGERVDLVDYADNGDLRCGSVRRTIRRVGLV